MLVQTQRANDAYLGRGRIARPELRGYHVMYHDKKSNTCPGCGGSSWHVGRVTAECAYCLTALPIQQQNGCEGVGLFTRRGHEAEYYFSEQAA